MIDATLLQIPTSSLDGTATSTATGATPPSADGFIQVLELFLGSSPLPSSLLGGTAIVQSVPSQADAQQVSPDDSMTAPAPILDGAEIGELDAGILERIACLLQAMGFQVEAADIQELSPLDMEQLGTALEFVQRNLERGIDPSLVAENAALLLPRPWEFDESSGAPRGTGQTTASTESGIELPEGFAKELESIRVALIPARPGAQETARNREGASMDATFAEDPAAIGQDKPNPRGAAATTDSGDHTDPRRQDADSPRNRSFHSDRSATDRVLWLQQVGQADPLSADAPEAASATAPRHLVPGGTTSELIGRQVLEKIHVQLSEGHRELRLRLWPEELGEVRMSLRMTDSDTIHANLVVENDAVRQALLDATPQLKDALSRHGLDLERMSVSVNQKDAQQAGDRQDGKQRRNDNRSGSRGSGWDDAQADLVGAIALGEDTGMRNGRNTIDLWS